MVKIEEIPNKSIKLTLPTFICDGALRGTHHTPTKPCPNHHFYWVFSGTAGSGKTSLAVGLLKNKKIYKGVFDNVIVLMPIHSLTSLKSNPFKRLHHSKVFHELDYNNLLQIYEMVQDWAEEEQNTLLFIDDMASGLKDYELKKLFNLLIQNRRHLRLSVMNCVQRLNAIPLDNRKLITHLSQFHMSNRKEWNNLCEELIFYPLHVMEAVKKRVFKKKGDFLLVDTERNQLYNKFNLLKIISGDTIDATKEKENKTKAEAEAAPNSPCNR